jgi:YgiT-type zinc finger domain-containing protein
VKCVVCKQGDTRPGVTTITLRRGEATFVTKDVPAQVCRNCGEEYVDAEVTAEVLRSADNLTRAGAQVDIRRFTD